VFEPLRHFPSGGVWGGIALAAIVALYAATDVFGQNMPGPLGPQATVAAPPILQTLLNAERNQSRPDVSALRRFYEPRGYRLAWAGEQGADEKRAIVIRALERAWEDGLVAEDYRRGLSTSEPVSQLSESAVAERDLTLTGNFLRYMRDMRNGRVEPQATYRSIELPPQPFDAVAALTDALADGDLESLIAELPPPHAQYARLKAELARYRELQARGGWPQLPVDSEIVLSREEPRLELLRQRLATEAPELLSPADPDLDAAVRRYQAHNGLEADGRVGSRTLSMLNIPVSRRVEQIIANMERWRWMPRSFETRHVSVNVAEAMLELIDNGDQVLTSRVIVGNPRTPSPMFRAEITGVTANPPWDVPLSIARNEMLPRLRRDRQYLADRNMVLVNGPAGDPHGLTINWTTISRARFPYQIRQLPGPDNALGAVKLELPNRFSVFLHDTPGRNLFARTDRFLSHGCIRVQEIVPLASYILAHGSTNGPDALGSAMVSGNTTFLALSSRLPVYILYWTAVTNNDGSFGFRHDIYDRDQQLIIALERRTSATSISAADPGCPLPD
jgi:murein L,D-transpeptidase YcbB/YkuD